MSWRPECCRRNNSGPTPPGLRLAVISYNVLTPLKRWRYRRFFAGPPEAAAISDFYTAGRLVHHAADALRLAREAEGIVLWLEALRFYRFRT